MRVFIVMSDIKGRLGNFAVMYIALTFLKAGNQNGALQALISKGSKSSHSPMVTLTVS